MQKENLIVVPVSKESDGLTVVKVNDYFNYMNEEGNLLSKEDFLFVYIFIGDIAVVQRKNGLWNYIKRDGTFLSPDVDFEAVDNFVGPFGYVLVDNKWLKIDKDGKIAA